MDNDMNAFDQALETSKRKKQVIDQCRVIEELAQALSQMHRDQAVYVHHCDEAIVEVIGKRSAGVMELLGNVLNAMDAASKDDEWMAPIFERAHRMFPIEHEDAKATEE